MLEQSSDAFSIQRFFDLLVGEMRLRARSIVLSSAVIGALIVLFHLSRDVMNDSSSVLAAWMGPIVLVWGLIEASKAFEDMHKRSTMPAFLLLPASPLEKTAARYILVTLVFGLYLCLFGVLVSLICAFMSFAILGQAITPPAVFKNGPGPLFQTFLITQSLFFLGAAWFRKSQATKTLITLLAVFITLILFVVTLVGLMAPEAISSDSDMGIDFGAFVTDHDDNYLLIARATLVGFFITVPVLSFVLSWFRVREVQLSDGI